MQRYMAVSRRGPSAVDAFFHDGEPHPPPAPACVVKSIPHRVVPEGRCDERAQRIRDEARRRGHTKREAVWVITNSAVRIVRRHLAAVVYRRMIRDLTAPSTAASLAA